MYAIISDLHANLEAVTAVLKDIESQHVEEILCLGDIVGYGPDPEKVIDLAMERCRFCISGNHDHAVLTMAEGFNPLAEEAVNYHRRVLTPNLFSWPSKRRRWRFLQENDKYLTKREEDILYVHGSPRDPRNEYILESDIAFGNYDKIEEIFQMIPRLCFVGHSHVPGVITEDMEWHSLESIQNEMNLSPDKKYIINVGSVGQPRDGDNRACYVVMDKDKVIYRRVEYDYKRTMSKMGRVGKISREAADRLAHGR